MTAAFAARASRQSVIFTVIVGLHAGVLVLMALGTQVHAPIPWIPKTIHVIDRTPPTPRPRPVQPEPAGYELDVEPAPDLDIPAFPEPGPVSGASYARPHQNVGRGPHVPAAEVQEPRLRTRDRRLAALVDACYPAGARRLGEEGRVVLRVMIGADGQAGGWTLAQSSGFPRLDDAVGCVLSRLEFVPGRRDGGAVDVEVLLPIVFRLD